MKGKARGRHPTVTLTERHCRDDLRWCDVEELRWADLCSYLGQYDAILEE